MTKLLQCLRDELVRRDYAAPTIRSYIQIVEAFRLVPAGGLSPNHQRWIQPKYAGFFRQLQASRPRRGCCRRA